MYQLHTALDDPEKAAEWKEHERREEEERPEPGSKRPVGSRFKP